MTLLKFLLDTNACIRYLSGRSTNLRDRISLTPINQIAICSIVKSEMFYGAMKSDNPQKTLHEQTEFFKYFKSLSFDDSAALIYGEVHADLTKKGTPIGAYDLQIAAIALAHNLTLITHNTNEFSRILNLKIEDWEI